MAEQQQRDMNAAQAHGSSSTDEQQDFASTLAALEQIVEQLESGNMPLEASLNAFERGVRLTRDAQQRLEAAELKVRHLQTRQDGSLSSSGSQEEV